MQVQSQKIHTYEENKAIELLKGLVLIIAFLALVSPFVLKFYKYF